MRCIEGLGTLFPFFGSGGEKFSEYRGEGFGRNRFAGALADRVCVAHAAPGSRTLATCQELRSQGKSVQTIHDPANRGLLPLGGCAIGQLAHAPISCIA